MMMQNPSSICQHQESDWYHLRVSDTTGVVVDNNSGSAGVDSVGVDTSDESRLVHIWRG